MSDGGFAAWLMSPAPPAWAASLVFATLVFKFYPLWKQRWTEARTAEDAITGHQWTRLTGEITRLDAEIKMLKQSEQNCREELADAKSRIAELEGYNIGQGKALQEAQRIVSTEREIDRHGRDLKK